MKHKKLIAILSLALCACLLFSCGERAAGGETTGDGNGEDAMNNINIVEEIELIDGMPKYAPNGNLMLLGTNIFNFDASEGFLTNKGRHEAAKNLGVIRFPTRQNSSFHCVKLASVIKGLGLEPLVILPSKNTVEQNLKHVELMAGTVKYYEFGNENNYADKWTGEYYAKVWSEHIPALREADPDMLIGGPVVSHFDVNGSKYVRDFLEAIKDTPDVWPDFISLHVYVEHGEDWSNQVVISRAKSWGQGIDVIRADCERLLGVALPIAVTEWNWDAVPEKTSDRRLEDIDFMTEFMNTVLDTFVEHGVWMSCQFTFAGGPFLSMCDGDGKPKAQYTAMMNWKEAYEAGRAAQGGATHANFTDIDGNANKDAILFLASKGIMQGRGANTFEPAASLTRAELASALAAIKGTDMSGYEASSFTDIPAGAAYEQAAMWVVDNKIMTASGKTFNPTQAVTRADMKDAVAKYAALMGSKTVPDLPSGAAASVRRDEAAGVIKKLYDLVVK